MNMIELDPEVLAQWRGPLSDGIDPARTALIVIDMQVGFIEEGYPAAGPHAIDIIPNVNRLIAAFRAAGTHIVFTRHTMIDEKPYAPPEWQQEDTFFKAMLDGLRPGASGHPLHAGIDVAPEDRIIDKYRYSAFLPISSPLDADLRARGIDTVVIAGTVTNVCCESSARDAHMLNYEVVFVADANAAFDDAAHNTTLAAMARFFAVVKTTDAVIENIINN
jgi:ureidoacrylate peracid hydrolase